MTRLLRLGLVAAALGVAACGSPRPLTLAERPADRVAVPTSSLHYRDYASADALAQALRWTERAPVWVSAHRGAPPHGLPENSVEAFENALNHAPALIETDVRRTADGVLVLMHDETLDRTTNGTGRLDAMPFPQVRRLRLVADSIVTPYRVPTLAEALAWADGRAVLMLDVKRDVPYPDLVAAIRQAGASDRVAVITYSLEDHRRLAALAPELSVSATVETLADLDALVASGLDLDRVIAWTGVGVPEAAVVARLHALGIRAQAGAFGAIDRAAAEGATPLPYRALLETGADVIASDRIVLAGLAARQARARGR